MKSDVLVILADGFEELEALAPVDVLRRMGACVTTAGLGKKSAVSSRNVSVVCDADVRELLKTPFDAVVIPGGMPGASNISGNPECSSIIMDAFGRGALVCAICASPAVVLAPLGILEGRSAVCYPGMEIPECGIKWENDNVCVCDNIVTARGAGCAIDFALEIGALLSSDEEAEMTARRMVYENWL